MFEKKIFGENVRAFRLQKDESQEQVANAIGIIKQTLNGIETGYRAPSIEVAVALASHFKVSLDSLMQSLEVINMTDIKYVQNGKQRLVVMRNRWALESYGISKLAKLTNG